ncbi:MAG: Flp pilus assembly complex ATPase component TadA [Rickettsiales bacterium]|jgi:type IV secretion system protein VirB11|nr:Flp pilus assembly complex ATPase component TadA [Rickettsiales bacterium]
MSFDVLSSAMRYISKWLDLENIEEIAINKPGEICIRLAGKRTAPWVFENDADLTRDYLTDLLYIVANTYEIPFDPVLGSPVVFAALPQGHRFTGIAGRNVMYDNDDLQGGIAISIRKFRAGVDFGFEDYGLEIGKTLTKVVKKEAQYIDDAYERFMTIIKNREPLLISGATSTGKTTFLNNILGMLSPDLRIITVEDTRELIVKQRNHVHVVLSRTEQSNSFNYAQVIDLIVRMTPDTIIGGEISTENAAAIWELMGTGHNNFLASIHAESPMAAYNGFIDRITHTYPNLERSKLFEEMKQRLHVVQISREGNLRAVTDVV